MSDWDDLSYAVAEEFSAFNVEGLEAAERTLAGWLRLRLEKRLVLHARRARQKRAARAAQRCAVCGSALPRGAKKFCAPCAARRELELRRAARTPRSCERCGKPRPPGSRRYCSNECQRARSREVFGPEYRQRRAAR